MTRIQMCESHKLCSSFSLDCTRHDCKSSLRDAFQRIAQPDIDCILYLMQYSYDPDICSQLLVSTLSTKLQISVSKIQSTKEALLSTQHDYKL